MACLFPLSCDSARQPLPDIASVAVGRAPSESAFGYCSSEWVSAYAGVEVTCAAPTTKGKCMTALEQLLEVCEIGTEAQAARTGMLTWKRICRRLQYLLCVYPLPHPVVRPHWVASPEEQRPPGSTGPHPGRYEEGGSRKERAHDQQSQATAVHREAERIDGRTQCYGSAAG